MLLDLKADKIRILTNDTIKGLNAFDYENNKSIEIYSTALAKSEISYDMFLGGALSVITLENPKAETNRELVIFRDSFGSSIAPLLVRDYAKVTLVDIRYIQADMLSRFPINWECDVLFLYSALVLNSVTLK